MLISIKMKKNLERVIEIPKGIEIKAEGNIITVKGNEKELKKEFDKGKVLLKVEGDELKLSAKNSSRRESKMIGTIFAHVKNMIKGVGEDFVYNLEICNVHFPMNVKAEGDVIVIKSFLGETKNRISKVVGGTKVEIKGNKIEVSSPDIEAAGQTAANLEKATKLTGRDRRIFQDGIFITNKPWKKV